MVSFPSIEVSTFFILGGNPFLNLISRVLEVSGSPAFIPNIEVFIPYIEASTVSRVESVLSLAVLLIVSLLLLRFSKA